MAILTFNLGPEASKFVVGETAKTSAFLKASTQIVLPANGTAVPVIGKATAGLVVRGDQKPVSNPATSVNVIVPQTIACIIPMHKDLVTDTANIVDVVQTAGATALAEAIDSLVATGFDPNGTAAPANFGHLDTADTVVVTDRASFVAALKAVALSGKRADSIVLSTPLLYDLDAETNVTTGAPVFNIVGMTEGTINGIPFYTFDSADSIGYIGAFKSASKWGTVSGIEVKVSDEASVTIDGVLQSLYERNLVAVRIEARYGFNFQSINNFVKFGAGALS